MVCAVKLVSAKWLKRYLYDRKQYVSIHGPNSSIWNSTREYSWSTLVYNMHINDIPEVDKLVKFILYADDANIIVTVNNMLEIEENMAQLLNRC